MTHRPHSLSAIATGFIAVTLALGVLLPGARPTGRERPMRRAARTGWSARSVSSGVWIVPDQQIYVAAPGSADGDGHVFQSGRAPDAARDVPPQLAAAAPDLVLSAAPSPTSFAAPARFLLSPSPGRAPPALFS